MSDLVIEGEFYKALWTLNMWRRSKLYGPGQELRGGHRRRSESQEEFPLKTWRTLTIGETEVLIEKVKSSKYSSQLTKKLVHEGHPRALLDYLNSVSETVDSLGLGPSESAIAKSKDSRLNNFLKFYVIDDSTYIELARRIILAPEDTPHIQLMRATRYFNYVIGTKNNLPVLTAYPPQSREELCAQVRHAACSAAGFDPLDDRQAWGIASMASAGKKAKGKVTTRSGSVVHQLAVPESEYEEWCDEGKRWIDALKIREFVKQSFCKTLFASGATWENFYLSWFPDSYGSTWFKEIVNQFEAVKFEFSFVPDWPMRFKSDEIDVWISEDKGLLIAWVEHQDFSTLLSINLKTFHVRSASNASQAKIAAGLALSFFIDCSISLDPQTRHPHFKQRKLQLPSGERMHRTIALVLPTTRFISDIAKAKKNLESSRTSHLVRGHRRQLPFGWEPSREARDGAPEHIRTILRVNETFVRAHGRGNETGALRNQAELSKFSALAGAISSLQGN